MTSSFDLVAPVEELREAQATSRAAGRRLGIVGGEAAALLFAFALLAAMTLRTDLRAARRRLAWYGARGWQLALVTVGRVGGARAGGDGDRACASAAVGGAVVAERAGAPVGACSRAASSRAEGLGARAARRRRRDRRARRRRRGAGRARRFGLLDAAALAAVGLVALELARGDGEGDLTLLLPALVTFAAAVARRAAAAAGASARRAARARPLARPPARLALARPQPRLRRRCDRLPRRQLRARALRRELPRDARARRARPGGAPRPARLRRPRGPAAADPGSGRGVARALRQRCPASRSTPVLRLTGGVGRLEGESGITLLGIPPASARCS